MGTGTLAYDAEELIKRAVPSKYWGLSGRYRIVSGQLVADSHGYTQMEHNFAMFFGLAVAAQLEAARAGILEPVVDDPGPTTETQRAEAAG